MMKILYESDVPVESGPWTPVPRGQSPTKRYVRVQLLVEDKKMTVSRKVFIDSQRSEAIFQLKMIENNLDTALRSGHHIPNLFADLEQEILKLLDIVRTCK